MCDIYHCYAYSEKVADDGQRNCSKHVEFYSKNKFEKLVHQVGFVIRIYYDALSPERQICKPISIKNISILFQPRNRRRQVLSVPHSTEHCGLTHTQQYKINFQY